MRARTDSRRPGSPHCFPSGVGAGCSAPHGRLVHDVVVIERRQVNEFGDGRCGDDRRIVRHRSELRGQNREQRTEALSTSSREMQRGLGEEVFSVGQLADQQLFDIGESTTHYCGELFVAQVDACNDGARCGCVGSSLFGAHDVSTIPVVSDGSVPTVVNLAVRTRDGLATVAIASLGRCECVRRRAVPRRRFASDRNRHCGHRRRSRGFFGRGMGRPQRPRRRAGGRCRVPARQDLW